MKNTYRIIVIVLMCILVWMNISSCFYMKSINEDVHDIRNNVDRIEHYTHETMMNVDSIEWRIK